LPTGRGAVPLSLSTMRASVPGRGMPMEPSFCLLSSRGLMWVMGEASVRP
jgi:hypothetical protein